jgi:probable selenium-dependent hydroxylase accessory protein YqeC
MIKLDKTEIITVVGAGGKTSLINYIANKYKDSSKILLTTTTKIYVPSKDLYKYIYMLDENEKIDIHAGLGIIVIGKSINKEKKIIGLDFDNIKHLTPKFDLILIEGDGSKKKKLKGWNDAEPLVYPKSTKTIGILDITSYDMPINDENIHRLKEFKEIIKNNNSNVDINNFIDIILNENGLFKNAYGEKILFINKVENNENEEIAKQLIIKINEHKHNLTIVYGSIKNNYFKY